MKKLRNLFVAALGLLAVTSISLQAQDFSGFATYKSASKMTFNFSSSDGQTEMSDEMKEQINKQMQKEYTLKFNVTESTWKEAESLGGGPSRASSGGNVVISFGSSKNGILYKNIAEGRFEEEASVFGKPFLIKDSLLPHEWQLTDETKKIGNYNCQKATYSRVIERRAFSFSTNSSDSEDIEENNELKTMKDTLTVTAWFTPEIPVSHGPESYSGLPGLILEVNNGSTTMVCDKVILNPSEGVKLEKPAAGKVVTREEHRKIQDEKMKEMQKKFSNGNGNFVIKGGNQ